MKQLILTALIFLFRCTNSGEETPPENKTEPAKNLTALIKPQQTDPNYPATNPDHYVVQNTQTHLNKLLLFIGGTQSLPQNYSYILNHAANLGLDAVSLSYPNQVAAMSLTNSTDANAFANFRDEVCFGKPVSDVVNVDALNAIETRTTKLLIFLKNNYPAQNWGQYLTDANAVKWEKVIVAGHSQGSGHAAYLAKKRLVDRAVMLSGPNDYSTYFNASASWLSSTSLSPAAKYYSLLHSKDEIVDYNSQVANTRALGLLTGNQTPVFADKLSAPYNNARALSLDIPAQSYHNSTVGQHPDLPAIWTYMFTNP